MGFNDKISEIVFLLAFSLSTPPAAVSPSPGRSKTSDPLPCRLQGNSWRQDKDSNKPVHGIYPDQKKGDWQDINIYLEGKTLTSGISMFTYKFVDGLLRHLGSPTSFKE